MKNIKTLIIKKLFSKFIRMRCPSRIPRSGKEGEAQNCFSITITKDGAPFLLVDGLNEHCIKGKVLRGNKYEIDASMPFKLLDYKEIEIIHYYGLTTIKYNCIWDYIINGLTKKEYIKILLSKIYQYFFNKQKLVMLERHELLRVLIDHHIKSTDKGIHLIDLMTKLYSIRWFEHPDRNEQRKKLRFYLESFVNSGDLTESNLEYFVSSKSILTLSEYEEDERRHKDNLKLQKKMVVLTLFVALFTLLVALFTMIQAGIVKFPTFWDLSR